MRLATTGLFAAKWTDRIHDEWTRSVLQKRSELTNELQRTRALMDRAVLDALVTGYEPLIEAVSLPDPDDRHVVAAAIRSSAQSIITFNLKDFPKQALRQFDLEALHPDEFVEHQLSLRQGAVVSAAKRHRAALRNPPKTAAEYLETLAANGLAVTADRLREYADLL